MAAPELCPLALLVEHLLQGRAARLLLAELRRERAHRRLRAVQPFGLRGPCSPTRFTGLPVLEHVADLSGWLYRISQLLFRSKLNIVFR